MKVKTPEEIRSSLGYKFEEEIWVFILNNFEQHHSNRDGQQEKEELTLFFEQLIERKKFKRICNPRIMIEKFVELANRDGIFLLG